MGASLMSHSGFGRIHLPLGVCPFLVQPVEIRVPCVGKAVTIVLEMITPTSAHGVIKCARLGNSAGEAGLLGDGVVMDVEVLEVVREAGPGVGAAICLRASNSVRAIRHRVAVDFNGRRV